MKIKLSLEVEDFEDYAEVIEKHFGKDAEFSYALKTSIPLPSNSRIDFSEDFDVKSKRDDGEEADAVLLIEDYPPNYDPVIDELTYFATPDEEYFNLSNDEMIAWLQAMWQKV